MSPAEDDRDDAPNGDGQAREDQPRTDPPDGPEAVAEPSWIGEIVAQLENDSGECWLAMESLADLDERTRRAIIAELSDYRSRAGVRTLLRLLSAARDPDTRSAARLALLEMEGPRADPSIAGLVDESGNPSASGASDAPNPGAELQVYPRSETSALDLLGIRIVRGLVTPVDGQGRATIVLSTSRMGQRRTAAFWCDVRKGVLDVVGEVEPESPCAGRLVEEWIVQDGGDTGCDVPELAIRLLGGSLSLGGGSTPRPVLDWVDGMLGPGFLPSGLLGSLPDAEAASILEQEMTAHARAVLEACPSWLDRSALTFELAEEITLREGSLAPDPVRDAGAYRFLFEHLLIHSLEMYRRMLLWMGWVWQGSGRADLSESAFLLASQLSDEQYEVPSHPFTVALSTRSLEAAQLALSSDREDP